MHTQTHRHTLAVPTTSTLSHTLALPSFLPFWHFLLSLCGVDSAMHEGAQRGGFRAPHLHPVHTCLFIFVCVCAYPRIMASVLACACLSPAPTGTTLHPKIGTLTAVCACPPWRAVSPPQKTRNTHTHTHTPTGTTTKREGEPDTTRHFCCGGVGPPAARHRGDGGCESHAAIPLSVPAKRHQSLGGASGVA